MYRRSLAADRGMIFPYDPPQDVAFWMKNTLIPLDMIFIRADGTIARIDDNTVPLSLDAGAVGRAGRRRCSRSPAADRPNSASAPGDKVTGRTEPSGLPLRGVDAAKARVMGLLSKAFTWWNGASWGTSLFTRRNGRKSAATRPATSISGQEGPAAPLGHLRRRNDGSRVPPGWNAWLRGTIDELPDKALPPRRNFEQAPHANLTGTMAAFRPDGSLSGKRSRPASTGDYQPWKPE